MRSEGRCLGLAFHAEAATNRLTYAAGSTKHSSMTNSYGGASTTVTYDSSDRETTRTTTFAGGASARSTTSRDGEDRATAWSTDGEASSASYDASGKLTGQAGLGWAGSSSGASYTYDSDTGRKVAENLSLLGSAADYSRSYLYTEAGRLAKATSGGAVWDYGFDERGNIASATTWDGSAATFAYDTGAALPDRLKTSVIGGITTEYRFDALARRESQGPPALPTQVSYTWDDDSRLVAYRDLGTADVEASFTYDAAGQRTSSTIRRESTTVASTYVYDGITLLSVAATETVAGQSPVSCAITYLYDETARPCAATYAEGGGAPQLIHLTTNDRGDVLQALDAGGTSFATYRYDAWGNAAGSTATGTMAQNRFARLQPLRYAGYCYDGGTGLYYLSARYYDPATYQFLSKDPAKDDGEESAYQYCGGDPVGNVDPTGEVVETLLFRWIPTYKLTAYLYRQLIYWGLMKWGGRAVYTGVWHSYSSRFIGRYSGKVAASMFRRAVSATRFLGAVVCSVLGAGDRLLRAFTETKAKYLDLWFIRRPHVILWLYHSSISKATFLHVSYHVTRRLFSSAERWPGSVGQLCPVLR